MTNYNIKQASNLLKKSDRTVRRYLTQGKFPHSFKDEKGHLLIPEADILSYLDKHYDKKPETATIEDRHTMTDTPMSLSPIYQFPERFRFEIKTNSFTFRIVRFVGDPSLIADSLHFIGRKLKKLRKKFF